PALLANWVGVLDADPIYVLCQHVGVLSHLLNRLLAVGLEYPSRSAGAASVAVQEQHDFADLPRLLPCTSDALPPLGSDAVYCLQLLRSCLDHCQDFSAEPSDQLLRQNRTDPLYQTAAKIPLDPRDRGRRHRFH